MQKRYLIVDTAGPPFFSKDYDFENHYIDGMIVFDLLKQLYTKDGYRWVEIEVDHL